MAANVALPGYRVFLYAGSAGSTTTTFSTSNHTAIADVRDIRGPSIARTPIDVTHFDSPSLHKEFIFGMVDPGEITFDVNWNPGNATQGATSNGLVADLTQTNPRIWILKFHGGTNWSTSTTVTTQALVLNGAVTGFDGSIPLDDKISASVTLKITGLVTWTTA